MSSRMSNLALRFLANCVHNVQQSITQECLLCGTASAGEMLCVPCDANLPRIARERCTVCALPLPGTNGETVCGACLAETPAYDHVCASFAYAFPADALVQA